MQINIRTRRKGASQRKRCGTDEEPMQGLCRDKLHGSVLETDRVPGMVQQIL